MRDERPSITAALVAFGRGVGQQHPPPDPLAMEMLSPPLRTLLAVVAGGEERWRAWVRNAYRAASLGLVDHVSARTVAIDRHLVDAVESGCRQLVLLGAGLDTRAHRIEALRGIPVLEVDHPATQRYKRRRVGERAPVARSVAYVAVDFERERLDERLHASGFEMAHPTVWIWEGVTMYLDAAAIEGTLAQVGALSPTGSRLITSYLVPGSVPGGPLGSRVIRQTFAAGGEELRAVYRPEQLSERLAAHGWLTLEDLGPRRWTPRRRGSLLFGGERINLAERRD